MSAFLDETGTLITVDHSNPLPVALVAGFTSLNDGELKTASYANPLPVTIVTTDYTEAELPDADDVAVGTEVYNTTYQVKMRSNGTAWEYLGIATATLSALPLPTAVPSGTKFNITDLGTGSAVFTSNGSHWLPMGEVLLVVSNVDSTVTSTTTETALATYTFDKKLASPNMMLSIQTLWAMTNTSTNINLRVKFGGTAYFAPAAFAAQLATQTLTYIRNRNSMNSQTGMPALTFAYQGYSGAALTTSTVDLTTVSPDIVITGQLAAADATKLTLRHYNITLRG